MAWHQTIALTAGSDAMATALEITVSVSVEKLSGYVEVTIMSPYFSFILLACVISSSPWEAVPVMIPILKSAAGASVSSPSAASASPPSAAAVVAAMVVGASVAAGSALRHPAK